MAEPSCLTLVSMRNQRLRQVRRFDPDQAERSPFFIANAPFQHQAERASGEAAARFDTPLIQIKDSRPGQRS
jgi:hypothetical protein